MLAPVAGIEPACLMIYAPKVAHQFLGCFISQYNEEFKRSIIERYLSGKVGRRAVAQEYGFDASTVCKWVPYFISSL